MNGVAHQENQLFLLWCNITGFDIEFSDISRLHLHYITLKMAYAIIGDSTGKQTHKFIEHCACEKAKQNDKECAVYSYICLRQNVQISSDEFFFPGKGWMHFLQMRWLQITQMTGLLNSHPKDLRHRAHEFVASLPGSLRITPRSRMSRISFFSRLQ